MYKYPTGPFLAVAAIAAFLSLSSCVTPIRPSDSALKPFAPAPPVADSHLTLPISFAPSIIGAIIDQHLGSSPNRPIYSASGYRVYDRHGVTVTMQLSVFRSKPTIVTWDGKIIRVRIRLSLDSDPRFDIRAGILHSRVGISGGPYDISLDGQIKVNPDWSLDARIDTGITWSKPPTVTIHLPVVGALQVDLSDFINPAIEKALPLINRELEEQVHKLQFAAYVRGAWAAVQKPIPLSPHPPVTLFVRPARAGIGPLSTNSDHAIVVTPAFVGKFSVDTKAPTARSGSPVPLPPNSGETGTNTVDLRLRANVSYRELSAEAQKMLIGKTFTDPSNPQRKVTLNGVSIGGQGGDRIYVKLDFHATVGPFKYLKGWLYFTGVPHYDDSTRRLRLAQVTVDADTNNVLVNAVANWILQLRIDRFLDDHLVFDLSSKVDALHRLFDKGITGYPIGSVQGHRITLDILPDGSLSISDFYLTEESIGLFANVKGTMSAHVLPTEG